MRHRCGDRFARGGPLLLEGLRQLEYSGYDSAGIATVNGERQLNLVGLHT